MQEDDLDNYEVYPPFRELSKRNIEILAKQPPITLEMLRAQCLRVKNWNLFIEHFSTDGTIENANKQATKFLTGIEPEEYFALLNEFSASKETVRKKR